MALLYGYAGSVDLQQILARHGGVGATATSCCSSASRCCWSGCCSRPARRRSTSGRRTSTRARRRRSPRSWRPARRSPRSARSCGCSTSAFTTTRWDWRPVIWAVAVITMVVGAILGLTQTDVKRMLAYSSIAHAGFILVGVLALDRQGVSSHDVLPADLRLHDDRRVRRGDAGPRRRRRGHPPVPVVRPGQALAVAGRRVHAVPARPRRHPADQRVHRQVRGLPGRLPGRPRRWSSSR